MTEFMDDYQLKRMCKASEAEESSSVDVVFDGERLSYRGESTVQRERIVSLKSAAQAALEDSSLAKDFLGQLDSLIGSMAQAVNQCHQLTKEVPERADYFNISAEAYQNCLNELLRIEQFADEDQWDPLCLALSNLDASVQVIEALVDQEQAEEVSSAQLVGN